MNEDSNQATLPVCDADPDSSGISDHHSGRRIGSSGGHTPLVAGG
jgi:hypothetical protein